MKRLIHFHLSRQTKLSTTMRALSALAAAITVSSALATDAVFDAIKRGDSEALESLLSSEPSLLEQPDSYGNTPLHWAARSRRSEIVSQLLKKGADVNSVNKVGATPLLHGVGNLEIVSTLLDSGAQVNVQSGSGMTPFLAAAATPASLPIVRLLVENKADVNARSPDRLTALTLAAANEDIALIHYLIDQGAEINPKVAMTPLMMASWHGHLEMVKYLLEKGADPNLGSIHAGHSLNWAFYGQHTEVARLLIEHGADLLRTSPAGNHKTPPMVWSAYHEAGDTSVASLLIARGVDVNVMTQPGTTALDWARARHNRDLEKLLLEAGAVERDSPRKTKDIPNHAVPESDRERTRRIRQSIQRAITLLQRSSDGFLENAFVQERKCISCHQQSLPAVAFSWARLRGFKLEPASLARQLDFQLRHWKRPTETAFEMKRPRPNTPVSVGYGLESLASLGYSADDFTEGMVWYVAATQQLDGHWNSNDNRPPMEDGPIQATAFALRLLQRYPLPGREDECQKRVHLAGNWLQQAKPVTFNQRAFQLLGLCWSAANPDIIQPFAERLLELQQADGACCFAIKFEWSVGLGVWLIGF